VGRDQADDMKLLRSINLDIATWEQARDAEATGKLDEIYRNIRWFVRTDDRWLLEYWFNDDVTNLVEIAATGE
jgi:hypothetical protein